MSILSREFRQTTVLAGSLKIPRNSQVLGSGHQGKEELGSGHHTRPNTRTPPWSRYRPCSAPRGAVASSSTFFSRTSSREAPHARPRRPDRRPGLVVTTHSEKTRTSGREVPRWKDCSPRPRRATRGCSPRRPPPPRATAKTSPCSAYRRGRDAARRRRSRSAGATTTRTASTSTEGTPPTSRPRYPPWWHPSAPRAGARPRPSRTPRRPPG